MANRYRGEVALEIEGEHHTLCLTLGALAELETQTETETLSDLIAVLSKPSTKTMLATLVEGLKAGSHIEHSEACDLLASGLAAQALMGTYNALIRATFLDGA